MKIITLINATPELMVAKTKHEWTLGVECKGALTFQAMMTQFEATTIEVVANNTPALFKTIEEEDCEAQLLNTSSAKMMK